LQVEHEDLLSEPTGETVFTGQDEHDVSPEAA